MTYGDMGVKGGDYMRRLNTPHLLLRFLADIMNKVNDGKMTPDKARAIAAVATVWNKVYATNIIEGRVVSLEEAKASLDLDNELLKVL